MGKNGNGNGHRSKYTAADYLAAIPGSAGVISTIAARVGCAWSTAKKDIEGFATVKQAYQDEVNKNLDRAESLIFANIQFGLNEQKAEQKPVDSADARWYLRMKGKDRGYVERQEVTGAEGGPVQFVKVIDLTEDDD